MFVFSSRAQITEEQCFCDRLWEVRDLTLTLQTLRSNFEFSFVVPIHFL